MLFPDAKFIHIGGDEVDKTAWKQCLLCQQRIKVLRDVNSVVGRPADGNDDWSKPEDRLQSYFIARMERYLNDHGRNIIGWDEILEGGLAPNAAVMSWRGEKGGIEAATMSHPVVMTPGSPCYFDHYQGNPSSEPTAFGGMNTLYDVFKYNPIPKALDSAYWGYVSGAQGNVWTEFMVDFDRVEYMVLPRMLALGEVLWRGPVRGDVGMAYRQFLDRVDAHEKFKFFEGCGFARSQYGIRGKVDTGKDTVWLTWSSAAGVSPRLPSGQSDHIEVAVEPSDPGLQRFCCLQNQGESVVVGITGTANVKAGFSGESQKSELSFRGHAGFGKKVTLSLPADTRYSGHGEGTLADGLWGGNHFGSHWLGFYGKDVVAIMDLDTLTPVSQITLGALEAEPSWIFAPSEVTVETSSNGKDWEMHPMARKERTMQWTDTLMMMGTVPVTQSLTRLGSDTLSYDLVWGKQLATNHIHYTVEAAVKPMEIRFIRVSAKSVKKLPADHLGAGKPAWLFLDEIFVR